jgi:hypothetical protein
MRRLLTILSILFLAVAFGYKTIDKAAAAECDANNVIMCGASTSAALQNGTDQAGTLQIFSAFGITSEDISNISSTSVNGVVTSNNMVWIRRESGQCPETDMSSLNSQARQAIENNSTMCLVGTNAVTAGRQNIAGSRAMSSDGVKFFERPPSVSFVQGSLSAFVVMNNGRFSFAILKACGNPVMATPVPTKTPPPVKKTVVQTPVQTQTQTQTQTVNVTAPPAVQAATTPPPAVVTHPVATTTLPNTGPGNIFALAGVTSGLGTVGHWFYSRRSRRS